MGSLLNVMTKVATNNPRICANKEEAGGLAPQKTEKLCSQKKF